MKNFNSTLKTIHIPTTGEAMENTRVRIKRINEYGTIKDTYMTFNGQVIFTVLTDAGKELKLPFNGVEALD